MPSNPYKIDGPAIISVSGGRTSGFMLAKIIEAHGGALPPDVVPVFCNTGLEHEATYRFLRDLGERWATISWLEYAVVDGRVTYRHTDYCGASRNGEPFTALIDHEQMLPNPVARTCTARLKIRTSARFCLDRGWAAWDNAIGLRADEPHRVHRMNRDRKEETPVMPMYHAGHGIADVTEFWQRQDFDLDLPGGDNAFGNCVMCFLKSRNKLAEIMRTNPRFADWWIEMESRVKCLDGSYATFRDDRPTYRQMLTQVTVQGRLYDDAIEDDTMPCDCTA